MISAIIKEIEMASSSLLNVNNDKEIIETIYFGGGTPSLLSVVDLKNILSTIKNNYSINADAEITIEANPDDITFEKLAGWKDAGINRLSIGIQSFKEEDLKWMNRAHNKTQAFECLAMAKKAGFTNFSVDLIYGTPGLTDDEWKKNVEKVIKIEAPHIACYALTVEPKTALQKMIELKKKVDVNTDDQARQFLLLMKWMKEAGYEHYEISNFAKPGFRSRHNSSYWQGKNYIGIGPSAHSYDGKMRKWNVANNSLYTKAIENNNISFEEENLSETNRLNEYVMTSLRTIEGLDLKFIEKEFSLRQRNRIESSAADYLLRKLVINKNENFVLTDEGKLFADGIASDLFLLDF
jgi:oxygen-independent coproporphyrinogen-3 oxidase